MTAVAAAVSAALVSFDMDRNSQSEFCVFADGRQLRGADGNCGIDWGSVASRFLLYFAVFGGALVGPFGLYPLLYALRAVINFLGRRRDAPAEIAKRTGHREKP